MNLPKVIFEANVEDLLDVNQFLVENYQAPQLIIGHSLGGSAAIVAASKLDNIKAVVTIGSPADIQPYRTSFCRASRGF